MQRRPDDVTTLPLHELTDRLQAWAQGWYPAEAGIALLSRHQQWLVRREFLTKCVRLTDGRDRDGLAPMAAIDWARAAQLLDQGAFIGSSSELQVLAAAVSLAGEQPRAYDLGSVVTRLDTANVTLLLNAVAHAAGWHQRGVSALVAGRFDATEVSL